MAMAGLFLIASATKPAAGAEQRIEIMPMVGTSLIGALSLRGPTYGTLDFKGDHLQGLAIALVEEPGGQLELMWTRSTPRVVASRRDNGPAEEFDVRVDRFLINAIQMNGTGQLRPFTLLGVGASHYRPRANRSSETRLTMAIGGGVKWYVTPWLGVRVDGRWAPDIALPKSSYFCEDNGTSCYATEPRQFISMPLHWLHYFDATAGLILRF